MPISNYYGSYDYTYILNLPCVAKTDIPHNSFITYPNIRFPNAYCDEFLVKEGEDLYAFLDRIHKYHQPYPISRELFLQLIGCYLLGKWPIQGGYIPIYNLWTLQGIQNLTINSIYCLLPNDLDLYHTFRSAQEHRFLWCIKVDSDRYLSLTKEGVAIYSEEEWTLYMKSLLFTTPELSEEIKQELIRAKWSMISIK